MFESLIGQNHIKKQLGFYLDAHKATSTTPFLMFNGAKGLGKTEFARAFAKGLNKKIIEVNCSTIRNSEQFFEQLFVPAIMDQDVTVLFDEAHALPKELVMSFLTIFNIEKSTQRHFNWRENVFEFNFERQHFIFATSEPDKLFAPFKDRLTVIDFRPYKSSELGEMVSNRLDWVKFKDNVITDIAFTLRGNARSAAKLSEEIDRYCNSSNTPVFGAKEWKELKERGVLDKLNTDDLNNEVIEEIDQISEEMLGSKRLLRRQRALLTRKPPSNEAETQEDTTKQKYDGKISSKIGHE
jgi:Holliday junction resolvasome RuvABC ATP-dependent DNA helicase subunit